jgi:hypothetical protein
MVEMMGATGNDVGVLGMAGLAIADAAYSRCRLRPGEWHVVNETTRDWHVVITGPPSAPVHQSYFAPKTERAADLSPPPTKDLPSSKMTTVAS